VFLTRDAGFTGRRRASFLSFNNGAAFCLLAATFLPSHDGIFGSSPSHQAPSLLALAALPEVF